MRSCWIASLQALVLLFVMGAAYAESASALRAEASAAGSARPFTVVAEVSDGSALLTREERRHLLARSGIGVAPSLLTALAGMTRKEAVAFIVRGLRTKPEQAMPAWVDRPLPHYYRRDSMSDEQRQNFNRTRDGELAQLRQWWIAEMLNTASPQTERLVFFWHDLFATSYNAIGHRSRAMALQNRRFRELGFGSWETLLKAMIRDPALLDFLDANSNRRKSPNENLARELLELFTLGEGNYDESTVKAAARALTGMSNSDTYDDAYRLHTWHHDRGEKTLFGKTARFDGDSLIEAILDQPASSRFLVRRFWLAFVSDAEPPTDWIDSMARRFRASEHDLTVLYSAVLSSDAFWTPESRGSLIKSPLDIIIGTARALEYPKSQWQTMATTLGNLEMDLFAPPNVAGWPEGAAFITPGRLLSRQYAIDALVGSQATAGIDNAMQQSGNMNSAEGMAIEADMSMETGEAMITGQSASLPTSEFQRIAVRVAAENYHGPARISLEIDDGETTTWSSNARVVKYGLDTLQFGRMQSIGSLPWHDMIFDVPAAQFNRATTVSIAFLNDAGGDDGDRNVYIDGIRIGERWLPADDGKQLSDCVPEHASDAGYLYCAGTLMLPVPGNAVEITQKPLPAYRSSAVQLRWANAAENRNRQRAMFILDHVSTPSDTFDLLSFELVAQDDDSITLNISSFSCLPMCFEQFSDCAWKDDLFPASKSMSFPLAQRDLPVSLEGHSAAKEEEYDPWCSFDELSASEQSLVAVLWRSVPLLFELIRNSRRGLQFAEPLAKLMSRLQSHEVMVGDSFWAQFPEQGSEQPAELVIDAAFAPTAPSPSRVTPPEAAVNSLEQLMGGLASRKLRLEDVLLSGVSAERFDSLSGLNQLPSQQQLQRLLNHPVFQVR